MFGEICIQEFGELFIQFILVVVFVVLGELNSENGYYVVEILCQVCQVNIEGDFDVVVIGLVNKGIINKVGILFSGYIEFFVY